MTALLGPGYEILNKKVVCGVPARSIPDWLKTRIHGNPVNNLGAYVRPQNRDVTYFYGIDFHQDLIDYKEREADFLTLYVYLHPVTRADAPLYLRDAGADAWFIVRSPLSATGGDLATAGMIALGSAGLAVFADEPLHQWIHTDPLPVRLLAPFRESSPISIVGRTWFFLLPLSAALYGAGHMFDSTDLRDAGLGCFTSNLTTTLTRTSLTHLVNRARPGVHEGAFQFELFAFGPWERRSFPGGHASNVMSCASYFNHRFDLGLAGPPIWAIASGVGLARMADDAHWASDTFIGMAYGYAVGRNVAHRILDRRAQPTERSLQPGIGVRLRITLQW